MKKIELATIIIMIAGALVTLTTVGILLFR